MGKESEIEEIVDLYSLGIDPRKKNELNDKQELAELADNIKQSMYHDYKMAFSREGDELEEEARSTVNAQVPNYEKGGLRKIKHSPRADSENMDY